MEAAQLIEVDVPGWELDCCGTPFAVGDEVRWQLHAAPPASGDDAARLLPRFVEEHHGQTPDAVPQAWVTGRVEAICAMSERLVRIPGSPRGWMGDPADTVAVQLDRAPSELDVQPPDGYGATFYRVRLRLDAGTPLPEWRRL